MTLSVTTTVEVVRRRDRVDPIDDRRLNTLISRGHWVRVTAGAFVTAQDWNALTPRQRHQLVVVETARRMRGPGVISHAAAAALWKMDILGPWPATVDVSCAPARGGRSSGTIRRHPRHLDALAVTRFDEPRPDDAQLTVTTPAQTAVDLARTLPFVRGVAVVDQAIRTARTGGPLTTKDDILALLDSQRIRRGDARARRAIFFADPLAANVRESQSRVLIAQLGFPAPRLQERRVLRSGRLVFGDFYWPNHDHWGELDGRGKYLDPEFGPDRPVEDIVLDEKARENEIRREVRGFSRWEPADCDRPRRLYDILTGDGLPSTLPRP